MCNRPNTMIAVQQGGKRVVLSPGIAALQSHSHESQSEDHGWPSYFFRFASGCLKGAEDCFNRLLEQIEAKSFFQKGQSAKTDCLGHGFRTEIA
jgi:hypothetical protein